MIEYTRDCLPEIRYQSHKCQAGEYMLNLKAGLAPFTHGIILQYNRRKFSRNNKCPITNKI